MLLTCALSEEHSERRKAIIAKLDKATSIPAQAPESDEELDPVEPGAPFPTLRELETAHIRRALEVAEGNKSRTAELLGISRETLYQKLRGVG